MLEGFDAFFDENWLLPTIASQIASVYARRQAENAVRSKREAALAAERQRQAAYQQQANQALERSMAQLTPMSQQQAVQSGIDTRVAASERRARPADAAIASGEYAGISPTAPTVVKEAAARAIYNALGQGRDYTRTLAGIKGFGDAQLGTRIGLGRTGQDLGRISRASQGSAAIVPYELDGAQSAGQGWRTAHDIFGGMSDIGQLVGMGMLRKQQQPQRHPSYGFDG